MAGCSFACTDVTGIYEQKYPVGKGLQGRFMYVEDGKLKWLLASFDFAGTFRQSCTAWRQKIALATGIPYSNIWFHELQIHAAPVSFEPESEPCNRLAEICIPVILQMMEDALEAEVSYVLPDMGEKFSMNREQYIPGLGGVTVWAGLQMDPEGRPFTQNTDSMLLDGYKPELPALKEPVWFDRPVDPQGALMVFRSNTGRILGTLSRFAAHPDVAVLFESMGVTDQYRYHFDWPGYLREYIDSRIGGVGVYINGPCANLSVKKGFQGMETYEACDREARRIGREIGERLVGEWLKWAPPWSKVCLKGILSETAALAIRSSIPKSRADTADSTGLSRAAQALKEAIESNASPARIKNLIDEKYHQSILPTLVKEWAGFTDEELKNRRAPAEIVAAALNGLLFVGLPGECLTETGAWIKAQTAGNQVLVMDQVNGYMGYMATPEAMDEGGYTFWGSWMERTEERVLRKTAINLVRQLWQQEEYSTSG